MSFCPIGFGSHGRGWLMFIWPLVALTFVWTPTLAQTDLAALFERARAAEKSGDLGAAEKIYQEALQREPGNLEGLKRLGIVEQTELKFDESIARFKQVLLRNASYPEVNFFLGVSYLGLNDFPHAIQSFEKELATQNPHPRCRYYLGTTYESAGHVEEAIAEFNKALADNPKDADALYQLARIYKNASVAAVDRLRTLDPESFQLHMLLAELHADEARYPEAIAEYQAALAKRPDARGIHYAIGVSYWAQRQMEPAKKEFLEALKENPNDSLTNLYLGDIAVRDKDFSDGLTYLHLAEKGPADMYQVHLLLGKCYRGRNEPERAKTEFLAAVNLEPDIPEIHFLLAQVYQELKDTEASAKQFSEFERLSRLEREKAVGSGPQN